METSKITGEISAPINEHPYVQDLTYVAIVEDYSPLDAPLVKNQNHITRPNLIVCVLNYVPTLHKVQSHVIKCWIMADYLTINS